MQEAVGQCILCHKEINCLDGFLNGVVKNGQLYCFACDEREEEQKKGSAATSG